MHTQTLCPFHIAKLHFPGFFAFRCGHMTKFWPMGCELAWSLPLLSQTHKTSWLSPFHHLPARCKESSSRFWSPRKWQSYKMEGAWIPWITVWKASAEHPHWNVTGVRNSCGVQFLSVRVIFSNSQPILINMASVSIIGRKKLKSRNKICFSKFPVSTQHSWHSEIFEEWMNDVLGSFSDLPNLWHHDLPVPLC